MRGSWAINVAGVVLISCHRSATLLVPSQKSGDWSTSHGGSRGDGDISVSHARRRDEGLIRAHLIRRCVGPQRQAWMIAGPHRETGCRVRIKHELINLAAYEGISDVTNT
jgi:hypothetical protein